jgi:gluconokinase
MLKSSQPDGSAWGAALIGMVATGLISDIADVDRHIRLSDVYLPRKDYYEKYQEMLPVYDSLYNSLVQTQNMI